MGVQLGALLCPFCFKTYTALIYLRHARPRRCIYCKKVFFFYRRQYYVSLEDYGTLNLKRLKQQRVF